jgi:hypothetical protein
VAGVWVGVLVMIAVLVMKAQKEEDFAVEQGEVGGQKFQECLLFVLEYIRWLK